MTSVVAFQMVFPLSKPGLPSSWAAVQLPLVGFTVQVKPADPLAPVVSFAVTVTDEVPAVVGEPEMRPEVLTDRPAGSPVADQVRVWPLAESVPDSCRLTVAPTVVVWLPGLVTVTVLPACGFTVHVKPADPLAPVVSFAVTVTDEVPAVVGEPEMRPEVLTDRPAGSPVADQVRVWPLAESVPDSCRLTVAPTVVVWLPGLVTVTVLPACGFTVHVKPADPLAPVVSFAVTVTDEVPAVVGEPEMRPEVLTDRPAGSPVADQVRVWPLAESVPDSCRLTVAPTVVVWLPGLVTVTVLPACGFTVHVKPADPLAPVVSFAVTVTDEV